jgi:cell division protein ZapA (FtsZ GTPase activity inhibitor)
LAVLAALNIADEYHLLKRNASAGSGAYVQRANRLAHALDKVLEEAEKVR